MEQKNTYVTVEQAEQIKKSIIQYFDHEIDFKKGIGKMVNLTLIETMIKNRTEIFK